MAERGQAEPTHQRPAGIDEGPQQDLDQQVQVIFLRGWKEHTHDQRQRRNRDDADEDSGRWAQACHDLVPNKPCGRMKIATMKNRKATAYPHSVWKQLEPTAMNWLMMKAAMKPPIMLPRPPSTQIMKISGPNCRPICG